MRKTMIGLAAIALVIATIGGAAASRGVSPVQRFSDGSVVAGAWSGLVTTSAGATMTLHSSDLTPGDVVTVWWVVFNAPENCSHGEGPYRCGPGDLPPFGGDGSAQPSVLYAAGTVVSALGSASYGAHLSIDDTSGALFGPGLTNPLGADIHIVLHDHGPRDPAIVAQELHSYGACNPVCTDVQFSVHEQ